MNDPTPSGFTPEQEQFVTELIARLCRRYADVIEKLATEIHALTMALVEKRLVSLERLETARRQLDLAYELHQVLQIRSLIKEIDELDAG